MKWFVICAWVLAHKALITNHFMSGTPSYAAKHWLSRHSSIAHASMALGSLPVEIKGEPRKRRRMRSRRFYEYVG